MSAKRRALVIEDDKKAQSTISSIFWKLGWVPPTLVKSGPDGLALLSDETSSFDVVILDQNLPLMTGLDVLAQARKTSRPLPPIIMVTGNAENMVESRANELGVAAFLMKNQLIKLKEVLGEILDK